MTEDVQQLVPRSCCDASLAQKIFSQFTHTIAFRVTPLYCSEQADPCHDMLTPQSVLSLTCSFRKTVCHDLSERDAIREWCRITTEECFGWLCV